jgi:hypothetical protein
MASIVSVNRTGKFPLTDDELILLIVEAFEQAGMKAVAGSIAGSHVNNHKVIVRSSSSVKRSDAFMPDAGLKVFDNLLLKTQDGNTHFITIYH